MEYTFHWRPVFRKLPDLLEAGLLTLEVAVEAMLIGIVLGLALAMIRMSGRRSISWFAISWVEIARNTPALLQLFFFGFGLGAFGIHLSPFLICLCALSFNNAGYLAENFRGGFQAVPDTQVKAARSLGMTYWQDMRYVVWPIGLRAVLPAWAGVALGVLKDSALVSVLGYVELLRASQILITRTQEPFLILTVVGMFYFALSFPISRATARLESRWQQ